MRGSRCNTKYARPAIMTVRPAAASCGTLTTRVIASRRSLTTLIVAACPGPAGVPGEPGQPGKPGEPGKAVPLGPVAVGISALPLKVGGTNTVNLNDAFNEPEGEALTFTATSASLTIATTAVDPKGILTVTAVAVGTTKVTVVAKDPGGLQAKQTFDVTVTQGPPPPVTIEDVKTKYPVLAITPTAAEVSKEIELPADHTLISENSAVVTVAKKSAATSASASSIRWAAATADTSTKNVWVVTAVAMGVTDVDVLDKSGKSVHTIRVTVTADPPAKQMAPEKKGTIPAMPLKAGATGTVDVSGYFSDPDKQTLTFTVASGTATIATASVEGSTVTVTANKAVGTATITVTATDTDKLKATQTFMVKVTAAAPTPGTIEYVKAKYPTLSITPTTAATVSMDIQLPTGHSLKSNDLKVVMVAKKPAATSAAATADMNVWMVTAVSKGSTDVDVLDSSGAKVHTIKVTVTTPKKSFAIKDDKNRIVDISDYLPTGASPSAYYMESTDNRYVDVYPKGTSDTEWEIEPISFGTADVEIIETATGKTFDKIKVVVENRAPIQKANATDPTFQELVAPGGTDYKAPTPVIKNENSEGTLSFYYTKLDVGTQFDDPDDLDTLKYSVRSNHSNYIIKKQSCASGTCDVWIDVVKNPRVGVSEFTLSVSVSDKAKASGPTVKYPRSADIPLGQTYTVTQYSSGRGLRGITVGERLGVEHTIGFGGAGASLNFLGTKDTEVEKTRPQGSTTDLTTGDTFEDAAVETLPTTATSSNTIDGSIRTILIKFGKRSLEDVKEDRTAAVNYLGDSTNDAKPQLKFMVARTGVDSITLEEHIWWDSDGSGTDRMPKWHKAASVTLSVNVVSIRRR